METRYPLVHELGEGPTVICLHASTSSHKQWLPLLMRLANRFHVIAVDLAGHGRKTWPGGSGDAVKEDLELLQAVAGSDPVHLVGHSYGAALALRYSLRHADRVQSLALYEPAAWDLLLDDSDPAAKDIFDLARDVASEVASGRSAAAARAFLDYWNGPGSWQKLPDFHQSRITEVIRQVTAQFGGLFANPLPLSAYASVGAPALLMSGALGQPCGRRTARLLAGAMPAAELKVFPSLGHMGPMTSPHEVNEAIEDFLARVAELVATQ